MNHYCDAGNTESSFSKVPQPVSIDFGSFWCCYLKGKTGCLKRPLLVDPIRYPSDKILP